MRGKRAYEDGDFAKAQELLQQALTEHPEPAARFNPYGKIYTPYLPQHYLGLIALKRGDCAGVRAQWGTSDNRQILLQLPDIAAEEDKAGAGCSAKVAEQPGKPPAEVSKPTAGAPKSPVEVDTPKPVAVEKPTASPPQRVEAPKPAVPVAAAPRPQPPEKPVAEKSGPPDSLVQAYDSYLSGRYSEVVRVNAESYADARARFHALLVRAAAKYTLSRMNGDDAQLASAKADAGAARALDARAAPDATLFSPDFREFYNASR